MDTHYWLGLSDDSHIYSICFDCVTQYCPLTHPLVPSIYELRQASVHLLVKWVSYEKEFLIFTHQITLKGCISDSRPKHMGRAASGS